MGTFVLQAEIHPFCHCWFFFGESHTYSLQGEKNKTNYLGQKSEQNSKRSSLQGNFVLQAGRCVSSLLWTPQDVVP